jgi:hypothetical protein
MNNGVFFGTGTVAKLLTTSPVWMTQVSDGVYQLKVTTEKDKNYFKFYEGSKWDESGNKKYYVRVRSYTTVNGTKYYGAWSVSKSVTTKK